MSFAQRRLAGLLLAACLILVLGACGGSKDPEGASKQPPATSGPGTTGGTTSEEEEDVSESAGMIELGARANVAYTCTQSDPVITEMADSGEPQAEGGDAEQDYPDGLDREDDYFWNWGGSFHGGNAEFDVSLFASNADADAWAEHNTNEESIRYGKTIIRYYDLDDHSEYDDNAEPLDTTAFTNSLHRCFDLAGGFD